MAYTVWIECFLICVFWHADTYISPMTPFLSLLVVINVSQMLFLLFLFLSSIASLVITTGILLELILYAQVPVVKFKVVHLQHWSLKNMVTFHVANMHHLAKNHSSTDACMLFYRPLRLLMYKFYHHHYFYFHNCHNIVVHALWSFDFTHRSILET